MRGAGTDVASNFGGWRAKMVCSPFAILQNKITNLLELNFLVKILKIAYTTRIAHLFNLLFHFPRLELPGASTQIGRQVGSDVPTEYWQSCTYWPAQLTFQSTIVIEEVSHGTLMR
jgi:hypothetical protein